MTLRPKIDKSNIIIVKKPKTKIQQERKAKTKDILKDADLVIGIDNGATGTIAVVDLSSGKEYFTETFSFTEQDYQQKSTKISRVDVEKMFSWLNAILSKSNAKKRVVVMERPMINNSRFKQSISAARAFEATLIVLQQLGLSKNYIIIDSKKWQHWIFGKNTVLLNLKTESMMKGLEHFNAKKGYEQECEIVKKHGDADSLFICLYAIANLI